MSDQKPQSPQTPQSPWSPPPPPQPQSRGVYRRPLTGRQLGWLALILVAAVGGVWAASKLAPERFSGEADWGQAAQWIMWLTIVAAGLVRLRLHPREAIRNILIWVVIAALVGLGYTAWTQFHVGQHQPHPPANAAPKAPTGPVEQA